MSLFISAECHKAKNLVPDSGSKPTKVGEKVLQLQRMLPNARVVYCSATGARKHETTVTFTSHLQLTSFNTCWGPTSQFVNIGQEDPLRRKWTVHAFSLLSVSILRGIYSGRHSEVI